MLFVMDMFCAYTFSEVPINITGVATENINVLAVYVAQASKLPDGIWFDGMPVWTIAVAWFIVEDGWYFFIAQQYIVVIFTGNMECGIVTVNPFAGLGILPSESDRPHSSICS